MRQPKNYQTKYYELHPMKEDVDLEHTCTIALKCYLKQRTFRTTYVLSIGTNKDRSGDSGITQDQEKHIRT